MKSTFNKSALTAILAAMLGMIPVAQAADGTINFTGTITDSACTVDTVSASQTVSLGTVSSSIFGAAGDVAAATTFTIGLNSCPPSVTAAQVSFDGTAHTGNGSILALTGGGGVATNVGVALYEQNGITPIPLYTPSTSIVIPAGGSATLTFVAKYMATSSTVTAGTANAVTNFTVVYP
ncbi:putative major fimbrial subunit LpfA [Saezia sanguinis]|uniref:Putative major fimbrial subunit LpfA n=1 Tax=Saezia sanguinis TaxID=1965230 RepID=A0A433SB72_9BURK|nr:fimbrial protein [Saezia sanguinis]RUS65983.1 putative major fimbrial subunit LpfA [Saezia sanguinis]